jgi:hypothetical protein
VLARIDPQETNVIPWCSGLPHVGEIRLSRLDISRFERIAHVKIRQGISLALILLISGAGLLALMARMLRATLMGGTLQTVIDASLAIVMVLLFMSAPASVFAAELPFQRGLKILRGLRNGHADVFAGRIHTLNYADPLVRRFVPVDNYDEESRIGRDMVVAILPASKVVCKVNWATVESLVYAVVESRAKPVPSPPEIEADEDGLRVRPMTDAEKHELRASARKLRTSAIYHGLAAVIGAGVIAYKLLHGRAVKMGDWILLFGFMTGREFLSKATVYDRAADFGLIEVMIAPAFLSTPAVLHYRDGDTAVDVENRWDNAYVVIERLAAIDTAIDIEWAENGAPAPWRRSQRRG